MGVPGYSFRLSEPGTDFAGQERKLSVCQLPVRQLCLTASARCVLVNPTDRLAQSLSHLSDVESRVGRDGPKSLAPRRWHVRISETPGGADRNAVPGCSVSFVSEPFGEARQLAPELGTHQIGECSLAKATNVRPRSISGYPAPLVGGGSDRFPMRSHRCRESGTGAGITSSEFGSGSVPLPLPPVPTRPVVS